MKKLFTFRSTTIVTAIALTIIGLRMHLDPTGMTHIELPKAEGNALSVAITLRHIMGSLLLAMASMAFFSSRLKETAAQNTALNGFITAFGIVSITLGILTLTHVANIVAGTIIFVVLTLLSLCQRLFN